MNTYSLKQHRAIFCEKWRRQATDEDFLDFLSHVVDEETPYKLAALRKWIQLKPGDKYYVIPEDEFFMVTE